MRMKVAVVFNQGVGDTLLLIPLAEKIKQTHNATLHAIFHSDFSAPGLIRALRLFDKFIVLPGGRKHAVLFSLGNFRYYDLLILNHTSASFIWLFSAVVAAKQVITNKKHLIVQLIPWTKSAPSKAHTHEILNNLSMLFPKGFPMPKPLIKAPTISNHGIAFEKGLSFPFIVFQVSAGNNIVKYKNWPIENWITFLKLIRKTYPEYSFALLGEPREIGISNEIERQQIRGVFSLIGKTDIAEATTIIQLSELYIGLDSGLMHWAAMIGKPTFTIWGPTSPKTYGYEQFDARLHKDLCLYIHCHPCLSWPTKNQSRVAHPDKCPDRQCITNISPFWAFEEFCAFWDNLQKTGRK